MKYGVCRRAKPLCRESNDAVFISLVVEPADTENRRRSRMITGMNHTGFVVRDLEKSVEFYNEVVGLQVVRRGERDGGTISQIVGYPDSHLKMAMLGIDQVGGHILELIEYLNPVSTDRPTQERAVLGASHLAFNVTDIQDTFQRLLDNGAKRLNPPVEVAPGRLACYLQDPDGNWIELIEASE
jgi:catechol 2,3-dioxygenase-like lactoylglutathione lyase family enzyme